MNLPVGLLLKTGFNKTLILTSKTRLRTMRHQLNKLSKGHSTKAERRFAELLKSLHIPFKTKVKIRGREVDFLIGKYAIEIDSHPQNVEKNKILAEAGYNPIHFDSWTIPNPNLIEWLKTIWHIT